jgi:hypothetical protein
MGHKVICDAASMEYTIVGPNKQTEKFDRYRMEEDKEYMQSIVDKVLSWSDNPSTYINDGTISTKRIQSKLDLSSVSTSDLLNEAFKRGAIKQMSVSHTTYTQYLESKDYEDHLVQGIIKDALLCKTSDLANAGVFNIGRKDRSHEGFVDYSVDYFICVHPIKLKKSNG